MSPKQHLTNCQLALRLWEATPPESVAPGLRHYRCGTQACFGGHLATWPEFQAMGVSRRVEGSPAITDIGWSANVSAHLFGTPYLFVARQVDEEHGDYTQYRYPGAPLDDPEASDHEVITLRLKAQIRKLEKEQT